MLCKKLGYFLFDQQYELHQSLVLEKGELAGQGDFSAKSEFYREEKFIYFKDSFRLKIRLLLSINKNEVSEMNKNKFSLFLILFLMLSALSAHFVAAAVTDEPWKTINNIITLQFMSNLGFASTLDPFEGIIRFLLLILLFTLFFKGAELLKLGRNVAIVIAAVISIISAIFVPGTVLIAAATSYTTIVSIVILGIPIFLMGFLYFFLKEHHWVRVGVMAVLIFVLHQMRIQLEDLGSGITSTSPYYGAVMEIISSYSTFVIIIAWILGGISLLLAFGSMGGSTDHHPNWLRGLGDRIKQKTVFTEKGKELRHAKIEETRLLSDLAVEQNELNLLKNTHDKTVKYSQIFHEIEHNKAVNSQVHGESLNRTFDELETTFKDVKDVQHQWKRAERREVAEMKRLLKEMVSKGVRDAERKGIEDKERNILGWYAAVSQAVKEADRAFSKIKDNHDPFYKEIERRYGSVPSPTTPLTGLDADKKLRDYLVKIKDNLLLFLYQIEEAANKEDLAVNETIKLAKNIKDKWVV